MPTELKFCQATKIGYLCDLKVITTLHDLSPAFLYQKHNQPYQS